MFPSVTRIISPYVDYSMVPEGVLLRATERGLRVHQACAMIARGGFPVVSPDDQGYLDSFCRWFEYVNRVLAVEEELRDEQLGVVGHPDLIVELRDGRIIVPDLKTPVTKRKTWKLQLALYQWLARNFHPVGSCSVQLKANGTMPHVDYLDDFSTALVTAIGLLNAYRYLNGEI
jgi:hypothetical protein